MAVHSQEPLMLSTIIYRSCPEQGMDADSLNKILTHSRHKNERVSVTGILLYDGTHFFQVLEGPVEAVNRVFDRISGDARHYQIVEIMRDYAPSRRFGKLGMETVDLRDYPEENLLLALLQKSTINTLPMLYAALMLAMPIANHLPSTLFVTCHHHLRSVSMEQK